MPPPPHLLFLSGTQLHIHLLTKSYSFSDLSNLSHSPLLPSSLSLGFKHKGMIPSLSTDIKCGWGKRGTWGIKLKEAAILQAVRASCQLHSRSYGFIPLLPNPSPNPTSGFLLLLPKSLCAHSHITHNTTYPPRWYPWAQRLLLRACILEGSPPCRQTWWWEGADGQSCFLSCHFSLWRFSLLVFILPDFILWFYIKTSALLLRNPRDTQVIKSAHRTGSTARSWVQ